MPEVDREFITRKLETEFSCSPVYLSAEVAERYYNGFSNSILWPLFHCEWAELDRRGRADRKLTFRPQCRPPWRDVIR